MNKSEFRGYHQRVAARLRSVAAIATTAGMRARLIEMAETHDRLALTDNRPKPKMVRAISAWKLAH